MRSSVVMPSSQGNRPLSPERLRERIAALDLSRRTDPGPEAAVRA
ncbi:MAG TPA: hypothetical protein VM347_42920 [Nonomuraea sp.]|nr:hypothetical protein [Nonomuraea sp.]